MNEPDSEDCAVCLTSMGQNTELEYTIPECGHKFHSRCIINWFRMSDGSCPNCRSRPNNGRFFNSPYTVAKLWKKLARRKNCPDYIKKICKKISSLKLIERDSRRCYNEFRREHKIIINEVTKKRKKVRTTFIKWRKLERELAAMPMGPLLRLFQF